MTRNDPLDGDPRSQRERMLAGDLYTDGDPDNERLLARAHRLLSAYNRAGIDERAEAMAVLDELIPNLGRDVVLRPPLYLEYGDRLTIGDRVFANFGLVLLDVAPIVIGADCQIGPNVQLLTPTHPLDPQLRRDKWEAAQPITLGENLWLGGGVIVCPGVTIGDNTVVGAGSVVTRDLPADVVAVGNPARVIRTI